MPIEHCPTHNTQPHNPSTSRRRFLQLGVAAASTLILPKAFAKVHPSLQVEPVRELAFLNLHTGEKLKTTYWSDGEYQAEALTEINHILRDHRTGDVHQIDTALLDLLNRLQYKLDAKQPFQIISGYRSPKTNAALHAKSNGVAKRSLHMQGKAIDIRLPGCQLSTLHKAALDCHKGGVGYYPKSNFVHVDTGRVRHWGQG